MGTVGVINYGKSPLYYFVLLLGFIFSFLGLSLLFFHLVYERRRKHARITPLVIIRDKEFIEIPADKIPVGKSVKNEMPFTLHTIELKKNDVLYAFTDGFADQFGGPNGKKLKYKQLCSTLLQNKDLSLQTQKENLLKLFSTWKGDLEQVDDVLIAGIRI